MNRAKRSGAGAPVRFLLTAAAAVGLLSCATGPSGPPGQVLDSRVRDREIRVDGSRTDWEGNLTRVGDSEVFAGFQRRGDALYVAVVSLDPGFDARVFGSGLTVWFDTAGTRRRTFGIRHPLLGPEARKRLGADSLRVRPDRSRLLEAAGGDLVLVRDRPGRDSARETRLRPGEAEGLDVASAIDRGLFTWELRLPLGTGEDAPHVLPAAGVDTVSVGLEAGGEQGSLYRAVAAGAPPDTTRPGRAAGGAGWFGGARLPPLELWVRVNVGGR